MGVSRPHWAVTAVGMLLLALIAYVAAVGGPEKAWLGVRAAIWGHPAPKIVSLEAERRDPATFILTIRNPALEDVVVTGYEATPLVVSAATENVIDPVEGGAGNAPLVEADEQEPNSCEQLRTVRLPRPLIIQPGRTAALKIRPWDQPCPFEVKVSSDHGMSAKTDTFEAMLRQFGLEPKDLEIPIVPETKRER